MDISDEELSAENLFDTPQGDRRVKVTPFPFDRPAVETSFVYRHLPAQVFASQEEFRLAYFGAAPKVMTFTFV